MLRAHGDIARARGMAQIAKDTGLGRESLYRALAPGAKLSAQVAQATPGPSRGQSSPSGSPVLEKKGDEQAPASPVAIQVGVDGLEPHVHVLRRRRNVRGETLPRPAFPVLCPPDFRRAAKSASVPPRRHSSVEALILAESG